MRNLVLSIAIIAIAKFCVGQSNEVYQIATFVKNVEATKEENKVAMFNGKKVNDETEQDYRYNGFKTNENNGQVGFTQDPKRYVSENTNIITGFYKNGNLVAIQVTQLIGETAAGKSTISFYSNGQPLGVYHHVTDINGQTETVFEDANDLGEGEIKQGEQIGKMLQALYDYYLTDKYMPDDLK